MRYWAFLSIFSLLVGAAILNYSDEPGEELVGSWEKVEVVCERDRSRHLSHTYDSDQADTISVLHFKAGNRGILEEIHLAKKKSCVGKSEFSVEYLAERRMKLIRGPMHWEGKSTRDLARLGCLGDEKKQVNVLDYSYEPETETLKLTQRDLTRVCKKLVSVYRRI